MVHLNLKKCLFCLWVEHEDLKFMRIKKQNPAQRGKRDCHDYNYSNSDSSDSNYNYTSEIISLKGVRCYKTWTVFPHQRTLVGEGWTHHVNCRRLEPRGSRQHIKNSCAGITLHMFSHWDKYTSIWWLAWWQHWEIPKALIKKVGISTMRCRTFFMQ